MHGVLEEVEEVVGGVVVELLRVAIGVAQLRSRKVLISDIEVLAVPPTDQSLINIEPIEWPWTTCLVYLSAVYLMGSICSTRILHHTVRLIKKESRRVTLPEPARFAVASIGDASWFCGVEI